MQQMIRCGRKLMWLGICIRSKWIYVHRNCIPTRIILRANIYFSFGHLTLWNPNSNEQWPKCSIFIYAVYALVHHSSQKNHFHFAALQMYEKATCDYLKPKKPTTKSLNVLFVKVSELNK